MMYNRMPSRPLHLSLPIRFPIFLFALFLLLSLFCRPLTVSALSQPLLSETRPSESAPSPSFSIHGVVEGFYGSHWTPEERLDIIRFMGEFGLQSYFYAPKDDPFHRSRWREPYSGEQLEIFRELLEVAKKNGVIIYYAISPGLDMVYSSEEDYIALLNKMDAMTELGIRHVALFLDDVPETLNHDEDIEAFNNLGEAHVHVINRLYADLKERETKLVVCPTTYTNAWGNREYVYILGEGIPEEIPLFWTGVDVAIGEITKSDALFWGQKMNRKPLIWDNFPVNDYDRWRVFLGPLEGRDPALAESTSGIVANPMNQPYASMIALATVADYVSDPYGYEPQKALDSALERLYPGMAIPYIEELIALYRQHGWEDNIFTPVYTPGKPFDVEKISEGLNSFESALDALSNLKKQKSTGDWKERAFHGLIRELSPFLENTRNDFKALITHSDFYTDDQGYLQYRIENETLLARETSFEIAADGDLSAWKEEPIHIIPVDRESGFRSPELSLVHDDSLLYFGIRIYREGPLMTRDPFFQGDHIMLLVDKDPDDPVTWIKPQDPMVIIRPEKIGDATGKKEHAENASAPLLQEEMQDEEPGAAAMRALDEEIPWFEPGYKIRVMDLTPFTQRGISDIHLYNLTGFFYHQVANPEDPATIAFAGQTDVGWKKTDYGYSAIIAIPHGGNPLIRATLAGLVTSENEDGRKTHRFLLSKRPYLGNTFTFPAIKLQGFDH